MILGFFLCNNSLYITKPCELICSRNKLYFLHRLLLFVSRIFLQDPFPANPDLLYLVIFIHSNLTTTVTLAFLFGSKVSTVSYYSNKNFPLQINPHVHVQTQNRFSSSSTNIRLQKKIIFKKKTKFGIHVHVYICWT